MANFTLPHVAVQASGTLGDGGGNEIWTFGFKVGISRTGTPGTLEIATQDDLAAIADAAAGAVSSFIQSDVGGGPTAGLISSWAALRTVKASAIKPDGKVDSSLNTVIQDIVPAVRGAASAQSGASSAIAAQTPYQVAVVATLRGSQFSRGPAAFGRFYIPVPNLHTDPAGIAPRDLINGLMGDGQTQKFAVAAGLMIQNMQVGPEGSTDLIRVINVSSSAVQNQVRWQPVDRVSVDNRPDTVRRRYNKLSGQGRADVVISLP